MDGFVPTLLEHLNEEFETLRGNTIRTHGPRSAKGWSSGRKHSPAPGWWWTEIYFRAHFHAYGFSLADLRALFSDRRSLCIAC